MVDDNADVDADDHCKVDETNTDRSVYLYHGSCGECADDDDDVNYENKTDGCGYTCNMIKDVPVKLSSRKDTNNPNLIYWILLFLGFV